MTSPHKRFKLQVREEINRLKSLNERQRLELESLRSTLVSTLHEARLFSSIISTKSYDLAQDAALDKRYRDLADNVYFTSGMLAARLGFAEMELNPKMPGHQARLPVGVYRKFDKARYLVNSLVYDKRVSIDFHGVSHFEMNALPVFDMVPFVLLQNAVKYSPTGYGVDLYFTQHGASRLDVKLTSYGPPVEAEELGQLCEKEFRGRHVGSIEGEGLGLYLAKRVCDLHNASLDLSVGEFLAHEIGGQKFQRFTAELSFEIFS